MTTTILDACGEDGDFFYYNGNYGGGITVDTTAGHFRSAFARCAVTITAGLSSYLPVFMLRMWQSGTYSSGWASSRLWAGTNGNGNIIPIWGLVDSSGILRIALVATLDVGGGTTQPYNLVKINAAGTQTVLATTIAGFSDGPTTPDKLDVQFNYAVSGSITVYINKNMVATYTGDITTDSVTTLGGTYHSAYLASSASSTAWSECILANGDTRDLSVVTCVANGSGTPDQWTGAYTNVNQIAVNDANFDTTATSGDVQVYTMTGIATGNFDILTLVTNLRATQGAGALTHIALTQIIGGTQYTTSPVNFPTSFGPIQFIQELNPATGQLWTQSDINAGTFQSGYKATT